MDNENILSSKENLLRFLGIKENFLYKDFSQKYYEKNIPKKNGGIRKIKPPQSNLKIVQRVILDKILSKQDQLPCVYGLSKNKNIVYNAKVHEKNFPNQLLVLDIENFFPSISRKQISQVFKSLGFNKENSSLLTKICTVDESLPQGSPTSPYLASLVCIKLDKEIYRFCKKNRFEYTRYFDDISISGVNILNSHIKHIEATILKYGFICNIEKKKFYDNNESKIINGVLISKDGLSVSDSYKKEIEVIYKELLDNKSEQTKRVFSGKFGFYLYINKKEAISILKELRKNISEL